MPPNDQAPAGNPEAFGPYLVYERLGVGGMATVHRAKERGIEGFERIVALKRLLPHLAEDASFVKSFVREAKLASMLQHANVVQLYELGRVGTVYFISMEYIDGRDVRRILRQARKVTGPPTINVTVSLLIQVCDALDYAHTRHDEDGTPLSIVHRDVSPSNLLVTRSGHLKVIDFGIAKAQSSQLRTATGRVKGKLAYMAPEAISGKELDARSDIFSAGVIAHELLTARPLFASKNEYQTLIKVQRGDVLPPSTFNQACPPELDAIVLRALSRDPDTRFHSAAEMRDELHGVRIKYALSATNREVASWSEWAFSLEAPGNNFSGPVVTDSLAGMSQSRSPLVPGAIPQGLAPGQSGSQRVLPLRAPTGAEGVPQPMAAAHDDADADVAWGGGHEGGGQPVVLEDVPDVSSKYPAVPHGVAAATAAAMGEPRIEPSARPTVVGHAIPSELRARSSQPPPSWPQGSSQDAVPSRPRGSTSSEFSSPVPVAGDDTTRTPLVDATGFGAGVVAGGKKGHLVRNVVIALIAAVAAAAAVYVVMERTGKEPTAAPQARTGKLKFAIEPADATVRIAGVAPHTGSPWAVDLEPGQVQVEIKKDGYKTYVTSLDLSAGETQVLRIMLEQADEKHLATISIDSTPAGLVAFLDDNELARRTPIDKLDVQPGTHTVVLQQNGIEVWRETFVAEADAERVLRPVLNEKKKHDHASHRVASAHHDASGHAADVDTDTEDTPEPVEVVHEEPAGGPSHVTNTVGTAVAVENPALPPPPVALPPPPQVLPTPPAPRPAPRPVAATAISSDRPSIVPPSAVKRLHGSLPTIHSVPRAGERPPSKISSLLCIDTSGSVTTVKVLTHHLPDDVPAELDDTMHGWRYAPYKKAGVARPACFVVSFRVQWPDSARGN
jgi:eukaryotic-like serine/threonine-protein kinase